MRQAFSTPARPGTAKEGTGDIRSPFKFRHGLMPKLGRRGVLNEIADATQREKNGRVQSIAEARTTGHSTVAVVTEAFDLG